MYQLKAGLLKSKLLDSTYEEVDLSSYKVKDLLNNYDDAYLVLTHYAVSHDLTLRLSDAEALIAKLTSVPVTPGKLVSAPHSAYRSGRRSTMRLIRTRPTSG